MPSSAVGTYDEGVVEELLTIASINVQSKPSGLSNYITDHFMKYKIDILCIQDCGRNKISDYFFESNNLGVVYNNPASNDPAAYLAIIYNKEKIQITKGDFIHYRLFTVKVTFPRELT